MKTRCPTCKTRYEIPPKALLEADGVAHCFRCGTVFEMVSEDAVTPNAIHPSPIQGAATPEARANLNWEPQSSDIVPDPEGSPVGAESPYGPGPESAAKEETGPPMPPATGPMHPELIAPDSDSSGSAEQPRSPTPKDRETTLQPSEIAAHPLPFDIPDDLEPLEPSHDVALDVTDTLYEKKSNRGFYYGLAAVLLAAGLGLQLAWQHRKDLLQEYPIMEPLCERIECLPDTIHAPEKISVLQRDIAPTANEPGSLTLSATIRNDADTAQPLPDIQLSLLDDNGAVLIRRRLTPAEYLFPPPPKEKLMVPGEVVTISLDFMDPGYQASGFLIGFL